METQEELMSEGDPVEAIDGLLAGIDVESVDLQHKATDFIDCSYFAGVWRSPLCQI